MNKSKVIIFGTGIMWNNRKRLIVDNPNVEIVCFIDNSASKIGKQIDSKPVESPLLVEKYEYDYILLMSKQEDEMRKQLRSLGVTSSRIFSWEDYVRTEYANAFHYSEKNLPESVDTLIFTHQMNFDGATNAIVYAAAALMARGQSVLICTPLCGRQYMEELEKKRIAVCEAPILEFNLSENIRLLAEKSRFVLVNVLPMFSVVRRLNGIRPVLWWIHEPQEYFDGVLKEWPGLLDSSNYDRVSIRGVGLIANAAFNRIAPGRVSETLLYGIPDEAISGGGGEPSHRDSFCADWRNHRNQSAGYFCGSNQTVTGRREESRTLSHYRAPRKSRICKSGIRGSGGNPTDRIYGKLRKGENKGGISKNRCRCLPFERGHNADCYNGGHDAWESMRLQYQCWNGTIYHGWKRGICLRSA